MHTLRNLLYTCITIFYAIIISFVVSLPCILIDIYSCISNFSPACCAVNNFRVQLKQHYRISHSLVCRDTSSVHPLGMVDADSAGCCSQ